MRYGICVMKMPFFVYTNFFFDDILFSFNWRTGSGTDDTIAEDKSSIPIYHHQHACMRESASWSVFQRYGSLPLSALLIFKTVFGRRPVRIMYVRK